MLLPVLTVQCRHDQMAQLVGLWVPLFTETHSDLVNNIKRSLLHYVKNLQKSAKTRTGGKSFIAGSKSLVAGHIQLGARQKESGDTAGDDSRGIKLTNVGIPILLGAEAWK